MTLSMLIRKGGLAEIATATPATLATHEVLDATTVAEVATVAVAATVALGSEDETAIRAWLAYIEETDAALIADVLEHCRADEEARAFFLQRAKEVPQPAPDGDDRRHCAQCMNLAPSGLCLAARRGEVSASRTYHPVDNIPRRCEGYAPGPGDPDRRTGRERWQFYDEISPDVDVLTTQMISAKSENSNGRDR